MHTHSFTFDSTSERSTNELWSVAANAFLSNRSGRADVRRRLSRLCRSLSLFCLPNKLWSRIEWKSSATGDHKPISFECIDRTCCLVCINWFLGQLIEPSHLWMEVIAKVVRLIDTATRWCHHGQWKRERERGRDCKNLQKWNGRVNEQFEAWQIIRNRTIQERGTRPIEDAKWFDPNESCRMK